MDIGKILILAGGLLVLAGLLYSLGFKGLPGDIVIKRDNFTFYFPIVTSLILSLLLSFLLAVIFRR